MHTISTMLTASMEALQLAALVMNDNNVVQDINYADRYDLIDYIMFCEIQKENDEDVPTLKQWYDTADVKY